MQLGGDLFRLDKNAPKAKMGDDPFEVTLVVRLHFYVTLAKSAPEPECGYQRFIASMKRARDAKLLDPENMGFVRGVRTEFFHVERIFVSVGDLDPVAAALLAFQRDLPVLSRTLKDRRAVEPARRVAGMHQLKLPWPPHGVRHGVN